MVKTTASVFLFLMILSTLEAFDFTLEHSVSVPSDNSNARQPCGVLQCNETLAKTSADQSSYSRQLRSLTIYKKVTTVNTGRWEKLASITSDHTSESKMSNGARIVGEITSHHAHLTLDLVDALDCQSGQFSCVVSMEDSQGRKSVKNSLVGKGVDPDSSEDLDFGNTEDLLGHVKTRDELASSAESSPQLMTLFQIKLDWIESQLENAMKNLENRLEDKVGDLKTTVIDRIERVENYIENALDKIETRTDKLENRLEDKLDQLDTRVTETLLLTKAITYNNDNTNNHLTTKIDGLENRLKDDLSQLGSCVTGIIKKDENDKDTGERLFQQLATVVSTVQSIEKNISCPADQRDQAKVDAGQSALTVSADTTKLSQLVTSVAGLTDLTQNLLTRVQTFSNSYAGGTLVPVDEFSDPLGSGKKEWRLVFRGTANNNVALYPAYLHGTGIPVEVEQGCKQFNKSLPCVNHYRNQDAIDNWVNIDEVLFAIYKDGEIVKHVVFNGRGSTYTSWFHSGRVILSSWDDLTTQPHNIFSIIGETNPTYLRRFFMSLDYDRSCDGYRGWFFAFDSLDGGCAAEKTVATPTFLYAVGNTFAVWTSANKALANAIGVFVKYE